MSLDSIPDANRLQTIRDGLFFIVGPHRAGTTLLQAMLSSHSALTMPPETGFFDQVWPRRQSLGLLTDAGNQVRIGQFVNGPDCSVSDLGLDWPTVMRTVASTPAGYDDLFVSLMTVYANSRGKRRAGEKSPRHLFAADEIIRLYPQAKFICLIRDPRGVVRSERETNWGSRSVCRITRRWCRVVDEAARLQRSWPADRFRMVRYEDLVAQPESTLRALCEFLGESFEPQMLRFHERPDAERGFRSDEVWKQNTLHGVDVGRAEQWRRDLSPAQIKMIERVAGGRLIQQGYVANEGRVGGVAFVGAWIRDHFRWVCELAMGVLRGRSRRRPWSSVWRDLFGKSSDKS